MFHLFIEKDFESFLVFDEVLIPYVWLNIYIYIYNIYSACLCIQVIYLTAPKGLFHLLSKREF